jgi:hypothetical protein
LDSILSSGDPEEETRCMTISTTGADVRLSHLLSSPSDEILTLAVKVYEKIPWGSPYFESPGLPNSDVAGTLLRRLTSPDCQVFAAAMHALTLFVDSHALPDDSILLESGILRPATLRKIGDLALSSNPRIQESVAGIFSTLGYKAESADDVEAFINAGVADAFRILLTSQNDNVRSKATEDIRTFTTKSGHYCNAFLSVNIIPALVAQQLSVVGDWATLQPSLAILEILGKAQVPTPLEAFAHPGVVAVPVELFLEFRALAEAAIISLARKYVDVPDEVVVTNLVEPIADLLFSPDDDILEGAASAISLIARHDLRLANIFLAANIVQPLKLLHLSSSEEVRTKAEYAIRSLVRIERRTAITQT